MVDLAVTATQVLLVSGGITKHNADVTIAAGQTVYLDVTTGGLKLAIVDSTAAAAAAIGIALNGGAAGQPIVVQTDGEITIGAAASVAQGTHYLCTNTAGGIGPDADTATGEFITELGIGTANDSIKMKLHVSGIAHV